MCKLMRWRALVAEEGLEQVSVTNKPSNDLRRSPNPGAAKSGADTTPPDPDLQSIIEHWPNLPDAVKAAVLALVRTASK